MSTKKLVVTTLLALAFFSQTSIAAFAEDDERDDDSTSFIAPSGRPTAPAPFERKNHGDRPGHDREDLDDDGKFQVVVPPMVITPDYSDDKIKTGSAGKPGTNFKVSPPKGGAGFNTTLPDASGNQKVIEPNSSAFDPNANKPIQMRDINPTKKTPADVFIESAQVGVGVMAAGAAALGIAAAARGARFRRQAKTDFIYEVETKE